MVIIPNGKFNLFRQKSIRQKIFGISLDLFAFRQKNLRIAPK
jgi:hypothetical protein